MTTPRYLRRARVEIGVTDAARLVVEDLRIAFDLRAEIQSEASPSTVRIWNLARDTERRIEQGQALRLYAGYEGEELPLLHQGEIDRVETQRAGVERITTLELGNSQQTRITGAIASVGKQGLVALNDLVAEHVAAMGFALGDTGDLPDARIENYAYVGKAADALTRLLRPRGVEWYVEHEEVRFATGAAASRLLPEFRLSEATGLIGSPSRTEKGADAKMLLTNEVRRDQRVRIESEALSGTFKTVAIAYQGDTWAGEWVTEIEAVIFDG